MKTATMTEVERLSGAMNPKEKATRKFEFIRSQFTESAFTELALFDRNTKTPDKRHQTRNDAS